MTDDEIISLAKESGLYETLEYGMPGANQWVRLDDEIKRFARLVVKSYAMQWENLHGFDKHGVAKWINEQS